VSGSGILLIILARGHPSLQLPNSSSDKANKNTSLKYDVSLELVHVFVPEKDTGNRDRPYDCALLGKPRDKA
jgi:hypothetical protein